MKKTILTLFVSLSCIMIANARWNPSVVDTLPARIVNGLRVIPIRTISWSGSISWKLEVINFEKNQPLICKRFWMMKPTTSLETIKAIDNWQDIVWEKVIPAEMKVLPDKIERNTLFMGIYVDKNGNVITADFEMTNDMFLLLDSLPQNMLKDVYEDLLKQKCELIKEVEFCYIDVQDLKLKTSTQSSELVADNCPKECIVLSFHWDVYREHGTCDMTKWKKKWNE